MDIEWQEQAIAMRRLHAKLKTYPLRQWLQDNDIKPCDIKQAYKEGKFHSLLTGNRTCPVSQMVKVNNTYFAWVKVLEK